MINSANLTRRTALTLMAGAAAAGPTSAVASRNESDPIHAVMENHQRLYDDLERTIHAQCRLEEALDWRNKSSNHKADPRWIAFENHVHELHDLINLADCELISVKPTTLEGVAALFRYVVSHERKGNEWRDHYSDEDEPEKYRSWYYHLLRNILPLLDSQAVQS